MHTSNWLSSRRWLAVGAAVVSLAAGAGVGSTASAARPGVEGPGQAPPEVAADVDGWLSHNHDLANTRATTSSDINSRNVAHLRVKWRFPIEATSFFGGYSSTPIVVDDTVYLSDLDSNVFALNRDNGRLKWRHTFASPTAGPNGLTYGWGRLYGVTNSGAFALDPSTGETIWSRELLGSSGGGIDIAPTLFDGTVLVSTVPATRVGYVPGVMGTVWALDARTGAPKWQFNTVQDPGLWGHPELNSGGGLWYPPAVDGSGRVFLAVANPAPFPGTPEFPNGSSRPGPNLYTNSLVALDGRTGKLLWYRQAVPHDIRDQDLEASPIITNVSINGAVIEIVLVAGKMGVVYAHRADNGELLWTLPVGRHQNDVGPLPTDQVTVFPGLLGGVIAPMALARGRLFVSWLDLSTDMSATTINPSFISNLATGTGALAAVDPRTGRVLWRRDLPKIDLGAATVSNDVVFTSTYDGTIYAFDVDNGDLLWTATARAGINSFPAIAGDMMFIGAAAPGFFENPAQELIAYGL